MPAALDADRVTNAAGGSPGRLALFWTGAVLVVAALAVAAVAWSVGSETTTTPATTGAASTTSTTSPPSDNLIIAILASGAALILAGGLYGRITSLKLPGGVEVGLSQEEKEKVATQMIADAKAKGAGNGTLDAARIAKATAEALEQGKVLKATGLPEREWFELAVQQGKSKM
jgi:hypothetical protein